MGYEHAAFTLLKLGRRAKSNDHWLDKMAIKYTEHDRRDHQGCPLSFNTEKVEATRMRFRPKRITTLFVGESAPISGNFFYDGGNAMFTYVQQAVEKALGRTENFLASFKGYGWYLDDLVLTPVNHMRGRERAAACKEAETSLAIRIAEYQPLFIVSLLKSIERNVDRAATTARCDAPRAAVSFPGMSWQMKFLEEMAEIIPKLPRLDA
jgi:hypothetical protein